MRLDLICAGLLILLFVVPNASGGAIPIIVSPVSVNHMTLGTAINSATANRSNAYVETLVFSQSLSVAGNFFFGCPGFGGGHPCYQMAGQSLSPLLSNPFVASGAALSGAFPSTRQTWINFTSGCAPYLCPTNASVECDNGAIARYAFGTSLLFNRLCFEVAITFLHQTFLNTTLAGGNLPILNVTRLVTYVWSQPTVWNSANPTVSTATVGITSASPTVWGSLASTKLTSWSVSNVLWILPYPINTNWYLPNTTITWLNTTQIIPQTNYSFRSNLIMLDWINFPASFCACGGTPLGNETIETYLVQLTAFIGAAGTQGGNSSGITGPSGIQLVPSTVVLGLGNITSGPGGNYTASVTWRNPYAATYANSYTLEFGVLSNATVRSISYNGVPFASTAYIVTSTAILILPGILSLPPGQGVTISVVYTVYSPLSTTSTIFLFNGFSVTGPEVLLLAAGAVGVGYALLSIHRSRHEWGFSVISFFMFAIVISAMLTLGGPL